MGRIFLPIFCHTKLYFVTVRKKVGPRSYYICLGDATYQSLGKQHIVISKKQFAFEEITYLDTADRELQKMLDIAYFKVKL